MKLTKILAGAIGVSIALAGAGAVDAASKKKPAADQTAQAATGNPDMPGMEMKFPTGGAFELRSINGKETPHDIIVTFIVDGAYRGTGNAGCNTWSATVYPVRGQRLAVGPVALTRKACDKDRMAIEHMFTTILHASPFWSLNGSQLTLKLPNAVMVLERSL